MGGPAGRLQHPGALMRRCTTADMTGAMTVRSIRHLSRAVRRRSVTSVGQEADAGVVLPAALGGAVLVVAGDPQAVEGEHEVVGADAPRPGGVPAGRPARRRADAADAGAGDRAGAGNVAPVLVVEPALMAADVDGAGVGDDAEQRVAAGVVDPGAAHRAGGVGVGGRGVADAGVQWVAGLLVARGGDVDGGV